MSEDTAGKGSWVQARDGTFSLSSASGKHLLALGVFTSIWVAFTSVFAFVAWEDMAKDWRPEMYFIFLFPAVGVVLLIFFLRGLLQWLKFGRSILRVSQPPIIGSIFEGDLVVPSLLRMTELPEIILECTKVVISNRGGKTSSKRVLVWQEKVRPALGEIGTERGGSVIPFRIVVPFDCRPTDKVQRLSWRLRASAEIPGVDFSTVFEVPMPKTAASDPMVTEDRVTEGAGIDDLLKQFDSNCGIRFARKGEEGLRMMVATAASRSPGNTVGLSVFALIWLGAIVFMLKAGAPVVFPIVFGLMDLLFVFVILGWLTTRVMAQLTPDGVNVDTRGLWGRSSKEAVLDKIEGFRFVKTGSSQSGENMKAYYKVVVNTTDLGRGREIKLADMIGDKSQARAIVRLFEEQYLMLGGTVVTQDEDDDELSE